MKNILLLVMLFVASSTLAQINPQPETNRVDDQVTGIKWEKTLHDFGDVPVNEEVSFDFVFTNNGKSPLIISDVKPSCGCTAAYYPKKPVLPGQSEKISINFKASDEGNFYKTITVITNTGSRSTKLAIKGEAKEAVKGNSR